MKKLYSYLLKSFIGPFLLTFIIALFVLLMTFLWQYLDDLVGKGLETMIIIELMIYALMSLVPLAIPLSVLLASIMTFGNLGERLELLSIKASGISLFKIMRPLIAFSLILMLFAFYLSDQVIPYTNQKFAALLTSVKRQRPEMIIKEGVFSNDLEGFSIKVGRKDNDTQTLHDIMIYDHRNNNGNTAITVADSGYLNMSDDKQFMILTMFEGERYSEVKEERRKKVKTYPFQREKFGREEMVISVQGFDLKRQNEDQWKKGYKMQTNKELEEVIDSLSDLQNNRVEKISVSIQYNQEINKQIRNLFRPDSQKVEIDLALKDTLNIDTIMTRLSTVDKQRIVDIATKRAQENQKVMLKYDSQFYAHQRWITKHVIEWHRKYTLSLAVIIFFFIGAPLGAIIRKGGFGLPVVVSILLFIAYYLVSMIGEKVAREGVWSAATAMWISTVVFAPISVFLSYEAITDSAVLSSESYSRIIKKLNPFSKFLKKKAEPGKE